jgi:hypothetical protein
MSMTTLKQSAAVGITTSGTIGIGASKGTSMTEIAARYIPGQQPSSVSMIVWGILVLSIGFFAWSQTKVLSVGALLLGAVLVFAGDGNRIANKRQWDRKVKMYETGWICMQCGSSWIPQ